MLAIVRVLLGALLLFFGRKLFWLFVAGVGFLVALRLSAQYLTGQPPLVHLILAIVAGLIGAFLAVILERVAVGVAGFIAGGYLALDLLPQLGVSASGLTWLVFLIGGLIGAVLIVFLFDWALIVLSSLTGATLVARALPLAPGLVLLVFVGAVLLGVLVQAGWMLSEGARTRRRPRTAG